MSNDEFEFDLFGTLIIAERYQVEDAIETLEDLLKEEGD